MDDVIMPTDSELEGLRTGSVPVDTTPAPSPEILARAQSIVDRIVGGESLSQVGGGEAAPVLSTEERLRFMAHVLAGAPYEEQHTLLGCMGVTFRSLSTSEEELIADTIHLDEREGMPKAKRSVRYYSYAMGVALKKVVTPQAINTPALIHQDITPVQFRNNHRAWVKNIPAGQYRLLDGAYRSFADKLRQLYDKADDPSFWPTPL